MKLSSFSIALIILLSSSALILGADKSNEKNKNTKPAKVEKAKRAKSAKKQQQAPLTGSYIKHDIRQNGVVTDGPNPVYVLDNESIRNSGAADLRELLVFRGLGR